MGYTSKYKGAEIDALLDKVKQGGNGGGVPIVSSINQLEELNLPLGGIASVANNSVARISFRSLYQPTMDDIDASTGVPTLDKMSVVKQVEYTSVDGAIQTNPIGLMSKSVTSQIEFTYGGSEVIFYTQEGTVFSGYTSEYITQINEVLSKEDFVYIGMMSGHELTESDFVEFDKRLKVVQDETICEVFLKDVDTPTSLVKRGEVDTLSEKIEKKEDALNLSHQAVDHYDYNIAAKINDFKIVYSSETQAKAYINIPAMLTVNNLSKAIFWIEKCGGVKIYDYPVHWNTDIEWKDGIVGDLDNSKSYLLELTTIVSEEKGVIVLGNLTAFNIPLNS